MVGRLGGPELAEDGQDRVLALAGQLDVLALGELDDLVRAARGRGAAEHLLVRSLASIAWRQPGGRRVVGPGRGLRATGLRLGRADRAGRG